MEQTANTAFIVEEHAVRLENAEGKTVAEVTFPEVAPGVVDINHTFVDTSLRGQGMAGPLLEHAAEAIARNGWKARPTCSYAVAWFDKHPERQGLLA